MRPYALGLVLPASSFRLPCGLAWPWPLVTKPICPVLLILKVAEHRIESEFANLVLHLEGVAQRESLPEHSYQFSHGENCFAGNIFY